MSQNIGTLITATIRPNDSLDLIASAYANEILGGRHSVQSHSDMENIYDVRRFEGMECYVIDEGITYLLSGGTSNSDWIVSSVDWSQISNIPNTLSGYNIIDAWSSAETISYLNINYYTSSQTYTKNEISSLLNDYETILHAIATYQTKADMINYYTSAQTDSLLSNYYTSAQTDTKLLNYSLSSHTHTLSGLTDVNLGTIDILASGDTLIYKDGYWVNSAITISVDMSNYYTKTQVDTIIDNLTGFTGLTNLYEMQDVDTGITNATNGQALGWDSSLNLWTNIDVAIDLSAYYTSAQTNDIFFTSAQTLTFFSQTSHTHTLSGLSDVESGATDGQYLQFSGGTWFPVTSDALNGAFVHLTGDTMSGDLIFDFMTGTTDRILYVDNSGTVSEGENIVDLYISGNSLINYITSGDTTSGGTVLLWSGSTFVNTGLSAYTIYEGQRYIDNDYFYEYFDGNLYRTWYAKKEHSHDDRYYTIDQLSSGTLDWRYASSNSLIGLSDTDIDPTTYTNKDFLKYDTVSGWTNFYFDYDNLEPIYTNSASTPETIGGIDNGSTFSGKTMKEMWDLLLYPYQSPLFTAFSIDGLSGTYEYGTPFTGIDKIFNWTTTNDNNISGSSISISGSGITTVSGLSNDLSETIYMSSITNTNQSIISSNWTISAIDTKNNNFDKTYSIQWRNYIYYGWSGETLTTGATEVRDLNKEFKPANNFNFSYIIPEGNKYTAFYIAGAEKTISVKHVESSYAEKKSEFVVTEIQVNDGGGNPIQFHKYEQDIGGTGYSADATYQVSIT